MAGLRSWHVWSEALILSIALMQMHHRAQLWLPPLRRLRWQSPRQRPRARPPRSGGAPGGALRWPLMSAAMAQPRIGRMAMARSLAGSGEELYWSNLPMVQSYTLQQDSARACCLSCLLAMDVGYSGTCLVRMKGGL